jgi:hypothetical protein
MGRSVNQAAATQSNESTKLRTDLGVVLEKVINVSSHYFTNIES